MKVSEAIDRLEIGDTVWAKATVNAINFEGGYIRVENTKTSIYLDGNAEISLEEPQAEKVEVELTRSQADFMKEHENDSLYKLMRASIPEYEELFARARLNGYTVKPKRWVVKQDGSEVWYLRGFGTNLDGEIIKRWSSHEGCVKFTDRAKAEAVATLVEGSVEEV